MALDPSPIEGRRRQLIAATQVSWPTLQMETDLPAIPNHLFDSGSPRAEGFVRNRERELQRKIYQFEPKTIEKLGRVNAALAARGRPPLHLKRATEEVEQIAGNSTLSRKEKKKKIEALRKKWGLSKGSMKALFTRRLKRIYGGELRIAKAYRRTLTLTLRDEVARLEKAYGTQSPLAVLARKRLEEETGRLTSHESRLRSVRSLYKSMYPSFWSRFAGFFKKVFSRALRSLVRWFPPLMLHTVPGLGTALTAIFPPLRKPIQIVRNLMEAGGHLVGTVKKTYRELREDFQEIWRLGKQL